MEWQDCGFQQPGSFHYPLSYEQEMIDDVPVSAILSWRGDVEQAGGPGDVHVEWPMGDEQVFEPVPELLPGDSESCVAMEYHQKRNALFAGPRAMGWTLETQSGERKREDKRQLRSHFF